MATVITDDKHYKNIANAIRTRLDRYVEYKPEHMADGVNSVYTIAYEKGKNSATIEDLGKKTDKTEGYVFYKGLNSAGECTQIETISMEYIPVNAFRNMSTLEQAIIGEGTISLRNSAFYQCTTLSTVRFPSTLQHLQATCFGACTSLDNINLPKSLTLINAQAFNGCTGIKTFIVAQDFNCSLPLGQCSALTVQSVKYGIIEQFKTNSGKTLTLHPNVFAQLSADDIAVATAKGLTITSA